MLINDGEERHEDSAEKEWHIYNQMMIRGVSVILLVLQGCRKSEARLSFGFLFTLVFAGWREWQPRRVINPPSRPLTSKCFQPHTALLLGPAWHFSALSLWGCNINKASLKVHQLLKLSWSLPITVTTPCVQHKNMFSPRNSQQTVRNDGQGEQMRAAADTVRRVWRSAGVGGGVGGANTKALFNT